MSRWPAAAILALLVLNACASRNAPVQDEESRLPLPQVRKIAFKGNDHFSARALRGAMATKQPPRFPPWKRGSDYNRPTLDADLLRLRKFYFDRGFLRTHVRIDQIKAAPENSTVDIVIAIDEGMPTIVQAVRLEGPTVAEILPKASEAQVLGTLPLQPDKPITKEAFDQSRSQLLTLMHDAGYARAKVIPETKVDFDNHEASVTFTLQPGALTPLGNLTITGNEQVEAKAIRRQILLREGEPYSGEAIEDTQDDIYHLGMFRTVTPRLLNLDDEQGAPLDIEFNVRERKPRTIEVAFGASSVEQFRLGATWIHRNLFGGAERFWASGKVSAIVQKAEANFHMPYFLAPRTSFTQTIFVNNYSTINTDPTGILESLFDFEDPFPGYDWLSIGAISRLEYRLTRKLTTFGGLELSANDFYSIEMDVDPGVNTEDNLLFIQFAGLRLELRDDVLDPTRGVYLNGRFDHSTMALLSDVNFAKVLFEVRYYRHIGWRLILATRFLIGGIQPYGGSEDIPQNVRFFAGGPGSVRGYAINRLGPLDEDGDPIGGNSRMEGNVEFRYPILTHLQVAVFVDFGNVFASTFSYALDELRYAVGAGIRILTPVGPLRVDYGVVIDRRPDEDFGRLEFSIGQAF